METIAVVLKQPEHIELSRLALTAPTADDVVVDVEWSGVSTGTERLLWSGRMPPFPGMGYPLVPGYESVGRVVEAGSRLPAASRANASSSPARSCFGDVRGLFGGAGVAAGRARRSASLPLDRALGEQGILLALAATAYHALAARGAALPDLHRRARRARPAARAALSIAARRRAAGRVGDATPARVERRRRLRRARSRARCAPRLPRIYDVSGDAGLLDTLIGRLAPGGEIVLAGFYSEPLSFAFRAGLHARGAHPRRRRMAAADLLAVKAPDRRRSPVARRPDHPSPRGRRPRRTPIASRSTMPACLKMVLDWRALLMNAVRPSISMTGRVCAPKRRSSPMRRCRPAGDEGNADHRDLRQGRHRQELHPRQPVLHDGAAGQAVLLIGCDPEERHDLAAVRRPRLPDHHRDLVEEEARRRGGEDRRRLLQARRRVRHGARRPGGRPRLRRPRHHPRLRAAGEARLPRVGLRLRAARLPGRRGLRRLRPADRARHVPEGHRRRLERPAVALRRQQRLLGGGIFPQARRQCRRRRHGHQQGRRHRRGRRPSPKRSAFPCWRRSRPTTTSAARARITRSSAGPAATGRRCSRSSRPTSADAPPVRPTPLTQDGLLGLFKGEAVGRGVVLEPATLEDMCGSSRRRQAVARSRLRRGVTADAMNVIRLDAARSPTRRPDARAARAGLPPQRATAWLPRRQRELQAAADAAGKSETLDALCRRLSAAARTTSRRACARPSARCASGCACGAPRRSCRARPAASTA